MSATRFAATALFLLLLADQPPFTPTPLTEKNLFTAGIEGPACDADGSIYAVNFDRQHTIGKVTPDGHATLFVTLPDNSTGNGIVFDHAGLMYVADHTAHNILRIDPKTRHISTFAHEPRMNQPNDLAITADGTIYASDPSWKNNTGQIWRIDPAGQVTLAAPDMGTTNGIEVSPDNKTLYVNETVQRNVWSFHIEPDGSLTNKRLIHQFQDGGMDGMRCDVDGNVWVSSNAGRNVGYSGVTVWNPDGKLIGRIRIPEVVANISFGGPKRNRLFMAGSQSLYALYTNTQGAAPG